MKKSRSQKNGKDNAAAREFNFSLVLDGVPELTSAVEDALFKAGCDDATFSIQYGHLYAEFTRSAPSLGAAIVSAIRDIRKSNIGAEVVRVDECELVTPAEIARRVGRSRQLVFQYINGQRGPNNFPAPECHLTAGRPLWAWCEVSHWFAQHHVIPPDTAANAEQIAAINAAIEAHRHRKTSAKLMAQVLDEVA